MFQRIWTPFVERSLSSILTIVSLLFFGRLGGAVKRTGRRVPLATWENNDPSLALPSARVTTRQFKQGLHYKQRFASDLHNVSTLFSKSSSKIPSSAIKDCRRLGKFNPDSVRPRPILVRFNTCAAVLDILANRSSFSPYIIKPDQSPQERTREKILLKERWNLCQSGVNKSSIKIKGNSLIVHDHLFGKVNKDSVFTIVHTDPTPPSNNSTTPSSCDSNSTTPSSLPPEGSMTTPMATNSPSHC